MSRAAERGALLARAAAAPLAVGLLSIAARLPFLSLPMISDEGGYAYVARFWSTDFQPYRDVPFDRPQGIFVLYKLALAFGGSIESIRLFAAAYNAATAALVTVLGRKLFGRGAGLAAGLGFAVFSAAPSIEGFTANAELFTLLPGTAAALALWQRRWLLGGLAAGAAIAVKPSALSLVLLGAVVSTLSHARGARLRSVLVFLAGASALPALCVLHGMWVDAGAFWASFVGRRLTAYSVVTAPIGLQLERFATALGATWTAWSLLALGAFAALRRWREPAVRFAWLWCACSLFGMALGGEWHEHYFQEWIAPLALLAPAGYLAWRAPRGVERSARGAAAANDAGLRRHLPAGAGVLAALALFGVFAKRELFVLGLPPEQASLALFGQADWVAAPRAARRVAQLSRPTDRVYSAFTSPQIYYYAERRAAVPQLFWRELLYVDGVWAQARAAIETGRPAVLLVSSPPPSQFMSPRAFRALVLARYRWQEDIGPFALLVPR